MINLKKNLLFVLNALNCGGAEKSLISLLQTINYSKYHVDLFLFKHEGLFLNKIPEEVNLLKEPMNYRYFDMSVKKAILNFLEEGNIKNAVQRAKAGIIFKTEKNTTRCDQRVWKYISNTLENINKEYDVAIGYLEMSPIYFIIDKVKAKKKIGWVHTNYTNSGMDKNIDRPYFEKLDRIVTVSEECKKSLEENFPSISNKLSVIQNIVSPNIIKRLAESNIQDDFNDDQGLIKIISVARLCHVKGIDIAIEACRELIYQGTKLRWYVLGTGTEQENREYQQLLQKYNLEEHFKLLGIKENPYPYIKKADIFVHPSRIEGKSIAIDEAKILQKPIIVTNFLTAKDQINNEENGVIVKIDPQSLATGIRKLIKSPKLRLKLSNNLAKEQLGNEMEVNKLYKIL